MDYRISYYTSRGQRDWNEDAVSVLEGSQGLLAIVADGLGGHADGQKASRQAVITINGHLLDQVPSAQRLRSAVEEASREILELQKPDSRMHTTVAVLWLDENAAFAAHVGDSRIYQIRDHQIIYQSIDHSLAQSAVLLGELNPCQLRQSRDRHKLIRVLGGESPPTVDIRALTVHSGDRFLLCSDGFWETVTEEQMLRENSLPLPQWLEKLREIVKQKDSPKQDNHTAIVLEVGADS